MITTSGKLVYGDGYKYVVREPWSAQTPIVNAAARIVDSEGHLLAQLDQSGLLTIHAGYAWDGPSGPTVDTPDSMRGSLAHDALYQMMRSGHLGDEWRELSDELLRDLCLQDGMGELRAAAWFAGVRAFAGFAAERQPETRKEAP